MVRNIVEFIVKELVEYQLSVRVVEEQHDGKIVLIIHVDPQDLGKVIGKGGQTIRSIRSVASVLNKNGGQVTVDIAK
jgi:uncharacterized protein